MNFFYAELHNVDEIANIGTKFQKCMSGSRRGLIGVSSYPTTTYIYYVYIL